MKFGAIMIFNNLSKYSDFNFVIEIFMLDLIILSLINFILLGQCSVFWRTTPPSRRNALRSLVIHKTYSVSARKMSVISVKSC